MITDIIETIGLAAMVKKLVVLLLAAGTSETSLFFALATYFWVHP